MSLLVCVVGHRAAGNVVENFDEFNSSTYIQGSNNTLAAAQQGTFGMFLRYGTAVTDGLYSSSAAANGSTGRGAVADATFASGKTLYLAEYVLTTSQNLNVSGMGTINLDIKVPSSIPPNLTFSVEVQDAAGTQYQSAPQSLSGALTYTTYSSVFSTSTATETVIGTPNDSLATVLSNVSQINLVFSDTVDTGYGTTAIDFDNLIGVTAVPESSFGLFLMNLGLLGVGLSALRKRFFARLFRPRNA